MKLSVALACCVCVVLLQAATDAKPVGLRLSQINAALVAPDWLRPMMLGWRPSLEKARQRAADYDFEEEDGEEEDEEEAEEEFFDQHNPSSGTASAGEAGEAGMAAEEEDDNEEDDYDGSEDDVAEERFYNAGWL